MQLAPRPVVRVPLAPRPSLLPVPRSSAVPRASIAPNQEVLIEEAIEAANELVAGAETSFQVRENQKRCREIFDEFYRKIKTRHLRTVRCRDILTKKTAELKKAEIRKQLQVLLNNFARELGLPANM